jgi:hypothetical protein
LDKRAFFFNFNWEIESASQAFVMVGPHSWKFLCILCSNDLFSSLSWIIMSCASLNFLFRHFTVFSPSPGDVWGFSIVAGWPYTSALFFLAKDLVTGDKGLAETAVLGLCKTSFSFDISFLFI